MEVLNVAVDIQVWATMRAVRGDYQQSPQLCMYTFMRLRCRIIVSSSYIMKTILIAAQKGGSGKTTLGRNLSVAATQDGRNVLCLDLDPQGSLRGWWEGRLAMEVLNVAVDIQVWATMRAVRVTTNNLRNYVCTLLCVYAVA